MTAASTKVRWFELLLALIAAFAVIAAAAVAAAYSSRDSTATNRTQLRSQRDGLSAQNRITDNAFRRSRRNLVYVSLLRTNRALTQAEGDVLIPDPRGPEPSERLRAVVLQRRAAFLTDVDLVLALGDKEVRERTSRLRNQHSVIRKEIRQSRGIPIAAETSAAGRLRTKHLALLVAEDKLTAGVRGAIRESLGLD